MTIIFFKFSLSVHNFFEDIKLDDMNAAWDSLFNHMYVYILYMVHYALKVFLN